MIWVTADSSLAASPARLLRACPSSGVRPSITQEKFAVWRAKPGFWAASSRRAASACCSPASMPSITQTLAVSWVASAGSRLSKPWSRAKALDSRLLKLLSVAQGRSSSSWSKGSVAVFDVDSAVTAGTGATVGTGVGVGPGSGSCSGVAASWEMGRSRILGVGVADATGTRAGPGVGAGVGVRAAERIRGGGRVGRACVAGPTVGAAVGAGVVAPPQAIPARATRTPRIIRTPLPRMRWRTGGIFRFRYYPLAPAGSRRFGRFVFLLRRGICLG